MIEKYEYEIRAIRERVSERTLLEQLAEEAAELSEAALKLIRAASLSDDNPTPITEGEAINHLVEEFNDVCLIAYVIGMEMTKPFSNSKAKRWYDRLTEREGVHDEHKDN